jgi:predicted flap endonuclease-1-like 5' DNA nuclease
MAEKTIVDKAGETVGVGIAMASDVAGAIKTAIGAAVTTVTEVLKKSPAKKAAKKAVTKRPAEKASSKKTTKKAVTKKAAKKSPAKVAESSNANNLQSILGIM